MKSKVIRQIPDDVAAWIDVQAQAIGLNPEAWIRMKLIEMARKENRMKQTAEQAAALEIMKQRLAEINEQERLMEEQLAARTPEEIAQENARWAANHQIEIETSQARHSVETEEEAAYREKVRADLARVARIADEGE
jgi:hypothetical protein